MSCGTTVPGWRSVALTANGKRRIVFKPGGAFVDRPVDVPCGRCLMCKRKHSRDWAIRCTNEARMHEDNVFVTLTYNDEHLPVFGGVPTLRPDDFVNFMKRLRKVKPGVRFLQAAEYGKFGRPHHHVLLFGCTFSNPVKLKESGRYTLYRSEELEALWTFGYSSFGVFGAGSAMYVTQYALKKFGEPELPGRVAAYQTMSRRPGLGRSYFDKYGREAYRTDFLVTRDGKKFKPPRYYDELLKSREPEALRDVVVERRRRSPLSELSSERRWVKHEVLRGRVNLFKETKI